MNNHFFITSEHFLTYVTQPWFYNQLLNYLLIDKTKCIIPLFSLNTKLLLESSKCFFSCMFSVTEKK